ncbi:DUF1801 domain-containing protein [Winogradskyella endarachnes]|uniref:DUF1801 domain-containing protein n=1 Tax=Winogradskyella endarachnes TaxID=2681965 RepID=A0A6L6UFC1_9FLAO|nr:DUF1801 domain-containing protein [Winogradskyella endarachnes]MUU79662.1 DUF1801 domain-containing protein [Winogradskyella endarachnes]
MNPAEEYILKQPEPYKAICLHLQVLIAHTLPEAVLLYKWRLPCYYIDKRPICYINQSKDYVDVGFWHSAQLSKEWDTYLVTEKRKVVKSLRYKSLVDIDDSILISILKEVEAIKEKGFYKKN